VRVEIPDDWLIEPIGSDSIALRAPADRVEQAAFVSARARYRHI
jgi:hypothetical protein